MQKGASELGSHEEDEGWLRGWTRGEENAMVFDGNESKAMWWRHEGTRRDLGGACTASKETRNSEKAGGEGQDQAKEEINGVASLAVSRKEYVRVDDVEIPGSIP